MTVDETLLPIEPYPCPECFAGLVRPRVITYFTWLGQELITVPNFPAWVCDVCGKREYDEQAIAWLNILLDPNAGKSTFKKRKTHLRAKNHTPPQRPALDS